jgi:hypothetical protein
VKLLTQKTDGVMGSNNMQTKRIANQNFNRVIYKMKQKQKKKEKKFSPGEGEEDSGKTCRWVWVVENGRKEFSPAQAKLECSESCGQEEPGISLRQKSELQESETWHEPQRQQKLGLLRLTNHR